MSEDDAAKAYDKAAICARGKDVARLNFPINDYSDELEQLQNTTVAKLAPVLRSCSASLRLHVSVCAKSALSSKGTLAMNNTSFTSQNR